MTSACSAVAYFAIALAVSPSKNTISTRYLSDLSACNADFVNHSVTSTGAAELALLSAWSSLSFLEVSLGIHV